MRNLLVALCLFGCKPIVAKDDPISLFLTASIKEINDKAPIVMSDLITLQGATVNGRAVSFYYTTKVEITDAAVLFIERKLCGDKTVTSMLHKDVTYNFVYLNGQADIVREVHVTAATCKPG